MALLTDSGWQEIAPDLLVLLMFSTLPYCHSRSPGFRRAVAIANETGTLANY